MLSEFALWETQVYFLKNYRLNVLWLVYLSFDENWRERERYQEKYQDLGSELQKIWNIKVKIIPLVVGSLGAIRKQFGNRLKQIGITVGTAQIQKTVLLGTARILKGSWNLRLMVVAWFQQYFPV